MYVTKTWSVVLLNKKTHIVLSQVYCVWQVVITPTIILNNPVFVNCNTIAVLLEFMSIKYWRKWHFMAYLILIRSTRWRSWFRHCATSRKVAGSIPDVVIGIFRWRNPWDRTMALGLTQPLREMSTRNISWGVNAAGAQVWQPNHFHVPNVLKCGLLNLLELSGPGQACKLNCFTFKY